MCPKLETLDLGNNKLCGTDSNPFAKAMTVVKLQGATFCPSLKNLHLSFNGINYHAAQAISQAMTAGAFANLETLDMEFNNLYQGNFQMFAQMLSQGKCPKLQVLDLYGNKITNMASNIYTSLKSSRPDLEVYYLSPDENAFKKSLIKG